jgi:predicted cobalt transporter CbtA
MITRVLAAGLAAGFAAGLLVALLQHFTTTPLIIAA